MHSFSPTLSRFVAFDVWAGDSWGIRYQFVNPTTRKSKVPRREWIAGSSPP